MDDTRAALNSAVHVLGAVSDTPMLDAELLLAHAHGVTREALLLGPDRPPPPGFDALLQRRLAHEPVAYITGTKSFWTLELRVTAAVLIPRPDSETLIEAAIEHFGDHAPRTVLDLGTGSGALLLASLDNWLGAWGLGVDRSADAIAVARDNADRLGFAGRASFVRADWADALDGVFDLILCNPPYVELDADLSPDVRDYEPAEALFAGPDPLACYKALVPHLSRLLAPGGIAVLEIGSTQRESVSALIQVEDLRVTCRQDLGRKDRCLAVTRR
jgi:release factor glutamine methyltransferase